MALAASTAYAAESAIAAKDVPIVIKEQSYQPCVAGGDTAQAIVQSHNLILQATFQPDGSMQGAEVYKGFSKWPQAFHARSFRNSSIVAGKPALLLVDYKAGGDRKSCGQIIYEGAQINSISYASILAEAVMYDAEVSARMQAETRDINAQSALLRFLNDHGDDFLHLQVTVDLLIQETARLSKRYVQRDQWHFDKIAAKYSGCPGWEKDSVLSEEIREVVLQTREDWHSGFAQGIYRGLRNLGQGLISIGAHQDALTVLCAAESDGLYLEAAVRANRKDLVNGKALDRIGMLADLDLGGMTLRGLRATGPWKNVDVTDTDFTNAQFGGVTFTNVNLADAQLALATYDCRTVFPPGFDPVARHMIQQEPCKGQPVAKVDLSNVTVKPVHAPHEEPPTGDVDAMRIRYRIDAQNSAYDVLRLRRVDLDGVTAVNTALGHLVCSGCRIKNADFTGARMRLTQADEAVHISAATFNNAHLADSDLNTARLSNVDFTGANLSGVRLNKAQLRGVNFTGANLQGADLKAATYDAATIFPAGFDPSAADMIKVSE